MGIPRYVWLYIIFAVVFAFLVLITLVSGGAWTIFAIPIGLVIIGVLVLRFITSGREGPQVVSAPHEPTGTPRSQRGDAETANVRVGQD